MSNNAVFSCFNYQEFYSPNTGYDNTLTKSSYSEPLTNKPTKSTPENFNSFDSLLVPVAGFMDYDPKYAASVTHRINKRAAQVNKNSWLKF